MRIIEQQFVYGNSIRKIVKQKSPTFLSGSFVVGAAGFEPATTWSQTRYANRTALRPVLYVLSFFCLYKLR